MISYSAAVSQSLPPSLVAASTVTILHDAPAPAPRTPTGPSVNRRRNGARSSGRKLASSTKSASPDASSRQCSGRKPRRVPRNRRGSGRSAMAPGAMSPTSSCSMTSIATTSSGLSSAASSMRTVHDSETIPDITLDVRDKSSSSSAASSAGFCEMGSTDDVDEDDFAEQGLVNFEFLAHEVAFCRQWSAPAGDVMPPDAKPKGSGKRSRKGFCPNLKNRAIQQYFNEQRRFYRQIYDQQFSVLSAIAAASPDSKSKGASKMERQLSYDAAKAGFYTPHQHLGLPPMPPPPTTTAPWMYANYPTFVAAQPLPDAPSPCEEAFLKRLRENAIPKHLLKKRTSVTSLAAVAPVTVQRTRSPSPPRSPDSRNSTSISTSSSGNGSDEAVEAKPAEVEPSHIAARAEFHRQIRERLMGSSTSSSPVIVGSHSVKETKDSCAPRDYSAVVAGGSAKCNRVNNRASKGAKRHEQTGPQTPAPRPTTTTCPLEVSQLDALSEAICDYYETVTQTEETLLKKLRLRDVLYYTLVPLFPVCGLYVVGSSLNGFGNEKSDMDLCLVLTNRELDQRTDATNLLKLVEQALAHLPIVKEQKLIHAKVPILRIKCGGPYDNVTVDLNANNSVAIKNSHLLCYYAFFDWRLRPLVAVVKEWAKRCNINDASRSSFTSYSLVLMVIHYLQCGLAQPVLPSLQSLFPRRFSAKNDIRSLNISIPLEAVPTQSGFKGNSDVTLGELLIGFFQYYAYTYNFETSAISVRIGKLVDRRTVARQHMQWSPVCIEEPFTHSNTAHSVYDERVFEAIKQKFREAFNVLRSSYDVNELLNVEPHNVAVMPAMYLSHPPTL